MGARSAPSGEMHVTVLSTLIVGICSGMAAAAAGAEATTTLAPPGFFDRPILISAHRGGRDLWPENTALAYAEAAKRWPDALLEGDVQLSKDGRVVMMHDLSVNRTTDGSGLVSALSFDELRALDAGYRFTQDGGKTFPYRGKGVQIPLFEEALAAAPDHRFFIELKAGDTIADAAIAVLRAAKATQRVMLASFSPIQMQRVKEIAPEIATCYDYASAMIMMETLRKGDWAEYRPVHAFLSVPESLEARFAITAEEVRQIRAKGIRYQVHTVNNPEKMRDCLARGVDSVLTDKPDLLEHIIQETRQRQGSAAGEQE
jgi:glycerophosphoryl diester phosphodiesterase